jgi:DNA-binding MarR family transcriptional regulator
MNRWTPAGEALTDLILEVFRVNGDLVSAGDHIAGEFGQSSARWQVLGAIEHETKTVPAIARRMGLTRQAVQRTVDVLADERIVEYLDNPAHRRSRLVQMTGAGKQTYNKILAKQLVWVNELSSELPFSEKDIHKGLSVLRFLRIGLERPTSEGSSVDRRRSTAGSTTRRKARR